jgi:hypothetical protein
MFVGFMRRTCLMWGLDELILEWLVVKGVNINLEIELEVGPW